MGINIKTNNINNNGNIMSSKFNSHDWFFSKVATDFCTNLYTELHAHKSQTNNFSAKVVCWKHTYTHELVINHDYSHKHATGPGTE